MIELKWAIVQHSGYGYKGDPTFEQGLETRQVSTRAEMKKVEKAGGLLFDDYGEAEDFCDEACEGPGIVPVAAGTFSEKTIDGLRIYIPVRTVTAAGQQAHPSPEDPPTVDFPTGIIPSIN